MFQSCRFDLRQFADAGCGRDTDYGFADGKPCIILSLNRLIGWMPVDYAPDSVPEVVKGRYKPNFVTFNCDGTVRFFYSIGWLCIDDQKWVNFVVIHAVLIMKVFSQLFLQNDFDKEHLGNVTYIPEAGIDGKYYPYAVMPNYQQPIVSSQILDHYCVARDENL